MHSLIFGVQMAVGRPTKFKDEYIDQAYKLSLLGLTDEEMAEFFGVAKSTFALWKKENEKFSDAIKAGKEIADAEVAHSLYKKANGFSLRKTRHFVIEGGVQAVEYDEEYPPDTRAGEIFLRNRQRSRWGNQGHSEVALVEGFDFRPPEIDND